jgi:hypothetical protein
MAVPQPQFLTASLSQVGGTYTILLRWINAVNYDRIVVAWGVGTLPTSPAPSSAEPDASAETYTIAGFLPSTSFVLKVQGGVHGDLTQGTDPFELYYSDWTAIVVAVPELNDFLPHLLFYRQHSLLSAVTIKSVKAFTAPILSGTNIGPTTSIGNWETDWTQLPSFVFNGGRFLLLYSQTGGKVFTAPIMSGIAIGTPVLIGGWESDWAQIVTFVPPGGQPSFLLYRQTGEVFTAPIVEGPGVPWVGTKPQLIFTEPGWSQIASFTVPNGDPFLLFYSQSTGKAVTRRITSGTTFDGELPITVVGDPPGWSKDWAIISSIVSGGVPFLLFYDRTTGNAFTAPINSGTLIGKLTGIGTWEKDWAHIGLFYP